jgi:hypothetical protein
VICSSETSGYLRIIPHCNSEDCKLYSYRSRNLKSNKDTFVTVLVSYLAYASTLKMEAICSFEISVDTQRNTRCYIPEDGTLRNHLCENLKSYIPILLLVVLLYVHGLWIETKCKVVSVLN